MRRNFKWHISETIKFEMQENNRTEFKRELNDRSIFELTPSFTVVTFPFENAFILPDDKINGNINGNIKTTLDIIKDNPTATILELAELTGKSQRTISRELKEYQTAGFLHREGARKNGRWIVK